MVKGGSCSTNDQGRGWKEKAQKGDPMLREKGQKRGNQEADPAKDEEKMGLFSTKISNLQRGMRAGVLFKTYSQGRGGKKPVGAIRPENHDMQG